MKIIISIITITIIVLILVFIRKNIKKEPSKIYDSGINIINNLQKDIIKKKFDIKKKLDINTKNKNDKLNFQDLENDFPVFLNKLEKNEIVKNNDMLLKAKNNLVRLLKVKDNMFELNKRLKERNEKIVDYVEDNRDRVFEAKHKTKAQKNMVKKTLDFINESIKKQEKLDTDTELLKMKLVEKQIKMAEDKLKEEKKKSDLQKSVINKTKKLNDDKMKQELSKKSAIVATKKADAEAMIAKTYKLAAAKSADSANAYMIKARKEKDAMLAKSMLNKVKKELLIDKNTLKKIVDIKKESDTKYLDKLKYEKDIIIELKNELNIQKNNVENKKIDIIKNGENEIRINELKNAIKKHKIAQLNFDNSKYLIKNMFKNLKKNNDNNKNNLSNNINNYKDKLKKQLQLEKEYLKKQYDAEYAKKKLEVLNKNAEIAVIKAKEVEKEQLRLIEIQKNKNEPDKIIQDKYDEEQRIQENLRQTQLEEDRKKKIVAELELQKLKEKQRLLEMQQKEKQKLLEIQQKDKSYKSRKLKYGNNGTVSGNTFCRGAWHNWSKPYCVLLRNNNTGETYDCNHIPGIQNGSYSALCSDNPINTPDNNKYTQVGTKWGEYCEGAKQTDNVENIEQCKEKCDSNKDCISYTYIDNLDCANNYCAISTSCNNILPTGCEWKYYGTYISMKKNKSL